MNSEFMNIIEYMERDKGIDKKILLSAIESAIESVARKTLKLEEEEEVDVSMDMFTGAITVKVKGEEIATQSLGRIAAQTAKQVITQRMREAETDVLYENFKDKIGDLVSGVVQRFEHGSVILDVGRVEAILPRGEQVFRDDYKIHDRMRVFVIDINKTASSMRLVVSRSDAQMVQKLFEFEVPEISEGSVEIRGIVREAGDRTKIAVSTPSSKIDCVGACVGMRGSRVKNIVGELHGEKIDIVRWDEDLDQFVRNALSPAEIVKIHFDEEQKQCKVVVPQDKLSLAIGKKGQNARLAAKLTGWDIDIVTDEQSSDSSVLDKLFKDEMDEQVIEDKMKQALDELCTIDVIEEPLAKQLLDSGFTSIAQLAEAEQDDLKDIEELSEELALEVIEKAKEKVGGESE